MMGLWKFGMEIDRSKLKEVAELWAKDASYSYLYIRKTKEDEISLGFTKETETPDEYKEYVDTTAEFLRNTIGNLHGWDIAGQSEIIKL